MIDYEELIEDFRKKNYENILELSDDEISILMDLLKECSINVHYNLDAQYPHLVFWMQDKPPHGKSVDSMEVKDRVDKFKLVLSLQLEEGFMGFLQ
jgi:hypothetical protein